MWIVRLALRRPYTIAVGAILILLLGLLSLRSMTVDIFPTIDIPVVAVVWNYPGLSAEDMERRVVILSERAFSTTVNGIERIESESIPGIGILRIYFQRGSDIGGAIAQISSVASTATRSMPPGITPPSIVQFNASNVPVAQMTITSDSLKEEQIFDYGLNFIRIKLFTIPGLSVPAPYGGKSRQINIDVDPAKIAAKGLSASDVVTALQSSNLIIPAGTARIGIQEFNVTLNSNIANVEQFNSIPVKVVGGATVLLGDVARVSDSFADQTNIVRVNGKRATYLNLLKKSDASTLAVVGAARGLIPGILATAPKDLNVKLDFDQSIFVRAAITSVLHEAVIASCLVSLMILAFLGSWRSVFVVCTSIPLAIFCSIIGLKLFGHSINIMTLGGLSLAIGMLVDDATVEVENIHRNRKLGLPLTVAILTGAQQIALPAIMATLAICIVFFPVVLLNGPARFLFTPMAMSVVFAMLASYVLSRTLVPLLCRILMVNEPLDENAPPPPGAWLFTRVMAKFNHRREHYFEKFQEAYLGSLAVVLQYRRFVLRVFFAIALLSLGVPFVVGSDFFPETDTGLMKLHFRAPTGSRIEETERLVTAVEKRIREIVPAEELETINTMIGIPVSYNLAFVPTENIAGMDAEILVALKEDHHATAGYIKKIRTALNDEFPGASVFFQPADIISQVLNFGLSSPIDVQIESSDLNASYKVAKDMRDRMRKIAGAADVSIRQVFDYPTLKLSVDRERASRLGITQRDVANSLLISLSSSSLVSPSYFLSPVNAVNYPVSVKVPLRKLSSVDELLLTPVTPPTVAKGADGFYLAGPLDIPDSQTQNLGNLATLSTVSTLNEVNHYNVQRVLNVTANAEGRDLGSVISDINKQIKALGELPKGMRILVRGQGEVMTDAFTSLGLGLVLAIFLVYLLMVVLFQSWLDPFIVMVAVPGALIGILWMLLLTGTTINVESFMGSIMAVGIAASNAILMVSFANEVRAERGLTALAAAMEAGKTRLRPVLMTALAMVLGMIPSALALGEGGEQNAPLGRAVIGGLLVATFVTLFIVPLVYAWLRQEMPMLHQREAKFNAEANGEIWSGSQSNV